MSTTTTPTVDTTPSQKAKGRPRIPVERLRVRLSMRVDRLTRDAIMAHDKPARWLDRAVQKHARRGDLLKCAIAFLEELSAQGNADADKLADNIRRELI